MIQARMLKTEEEVWRAVGKGLGRAVPGWVRGLPDFRLAIRGILTEASCLADQEEKLAGLTADENLHYLLTLPQIPARRARAISHEVPPDRRLEALAEILAAEARQLPEVQAFRREVLGGRLLSEEEVPEWITRLIEEEGHKMREGKPWEYLSYTVPKDEWRRVVPIRKGVGKLWQLKTLCRKLCRRYPLWQEAQAVSFVLCDDIPLIPKARIQIQFSSHFPPRIILNLDPRLSPEEVARIYAHYRAEVRSGRDRPMSEKHLTLAVFVAENEEPGSTWTSLMKKWNEEHPEWAYQNRHLFARDARAALRRVTGRFRKRKVVTTGPRNAEPRRRRKYP